MWFGEKCSSSLSSVFNQYAICRTRRHSLVYLLSPEVAVLLCYARVGEWTSAGVCYAVHQESSSLLAWWNWWLKTEERPERVKVRQGSIRCIFWARTNFR